MNKEKNMPHQQPEPVTATTGLDLRSIREARGISLKDIYNATRVTVPILEAIEGGRFHLLPEPVYARTFIKSYAKFLDIDAKPVLDLYEQYLRSRTGTLSSRENVERNAESRQKSDRKRRAALWVLVVAAVAASLLYLLCASDSKAPQILNPPAGPQQPAILPPAQPVVPAGPPVTPPADPATQSGTEGVSGPPAPVQAVRKSEGIPAVGLPAPRGAPEREAGSPDEKRFHLVIRAMEKTWLSIRADRQKPDETILSRGDVLERFAADSFAVHIGNAGGVEVSFQGQPLGSLGERGQVVRLNLP